MEMTNDALYRCAHLNDVERPPNWCPDCQCEHEPDRRFFVSAKKDDRYVLLLGPYKTHAAALANVDRGRQLAESVDVRACWYAYGTCSAMLADVPDLKVVFAKDGAA